MTRVTRTLLLSLAALFAIPATAGAALLTDGTLINTAGVPSAGTVKIYAFGLPAGKQKVYDSPLLGSAAAAPDGKYSVSTLDDVQLLRLARARNGYLDLVAIGDTPDGRGVWNYTVHVRSVAGAAVVTQAATAARNLAFAPGSPAAPNVPLHAIYPASMARAAQIGPCNGSQQTRKPESIRKLAIVGELNNAYSDGTVGKFTYARQGEAQTAFSVAAMPTVPVPGAPSLIFSGETVRTDTGEAVFPPAKSRYSRKLRTEFEITKYDVKRSPCADWESEVRVTSWVGGTNSSLKQNGLDKCDTSQSPKFEAGGAYHRTTGKAVRYTRAVEAFGINLSTQSGFSNQVTLDFEFRGPASKKHYLCGEDGRQSPYESGRVFSGSRK